MMHRLAVCFFAVLLSAVCFAEDAKEPFPHQKDETSLVRVKADPDIARDKKIVIAGYVTIGDYYNYGYSGREQTHYSVKFTEAGEKIGDELERAHIYLSRDVFKKPVDSITDAAAKKKWRIARVEVTLVDSEWNMLEVLDIQLYDRMTKQWEPWLIRSAKEQAANKTKAKQEQAIADKLKKANDQAALKEKNKSNDKMAASRLRLAKQTLEKNKEAGRKKIQQIIDEHPDTETAVEAKKILEQN